MIVDFQHHFTPRELIKNDPGDRLVLNYDALGAPSYTVHSLLYDLDEHVAMMDLSGIDAAWLTSAAGMCADLETSKLVNDKAKKAERDYPGRFIGAAHAHPLGGAAALKELARCRHELGFQGVTITSEFDGKWIDDPSIEPFWAEACKLGMFVFVHPALKLNHAQQFDSYDTARAVGREFSLIMAAIRLVCSGLFDRHPELTVHMAHLSGGIASMLARHSQLSEQGILGHAGQSLPRRQGQKGFRLLHQQQSRLRHCGLCRRHRFGQSRPVRNPGVTHGVRHRLSAGNPQARGGPRFRQGYPRAWSGRRAHPVGQCGIVAEKIASSPAFAAAEINSTRRANAAQSPAPGFRPRPRKC